MYKVIRRFKDKDGVIYEVGDQYPKSKCTKKRINELTEDNKYNQVYIEEVKDEEK